MLQWSSQYEAGVPLVDTEHKVLFAQIDKLEQMTREPQNHPADVDRLIHFLGSYVANHFRFEEQCRHRFHCPSHEENLKAHAGFLQGFGKLMPEYSVQGAPRELMSQLHWAASERIHSHILRVDIQLKTVVPKG